MSFKLNWKINMKHFNWILLLILNVLPYMVLSAAPSEGDMAGNLSHDSGSEEVLKYSAMQGEDKETGEAFMVYESVKNKEFEKEGKYSEMVFYVSPLFRLIPDPHSKDFYGRTPLSINGIVKEIQYTFWMECFSDARINQQAVEIINSRKTLAVKGKHVFTTNQVQRMRHGLVEIKPVGLTNMLKSSIKSARKPDNEATPISSVVLLDRIEDFNINVPIEMDEIFKTLLDDRGIRFEFTVYFNVMNLSTETIALSIDDIYNTDTYKNLMNSGTHYVTANQVNNIIKEVVSKNSVYHRRDPGIDEKIRQKSMAIFEKLNSDIQNITVQNQEQAAELEAKLLEGTGLSVSEFKPLTLMWDVYEKLETVEDHNTANQIIRDARQQKQAMLNKLQDQYQRRIDSSHSSNRQYNYDKNHDRERGFNLETKAGWDIGLKGSVTGNVDYKDHGKGKIGIKEGQQASRESNSGDNINRDRSKNHTFNDQSEFNYFNNNDELKTYQEQTTEQKRPEVKIIGRGLNVIERSKLEQHIKTERSYLYVQPKTEAGIFTASSRISKHSKMTQFSTLVDKMLEQENRLKKWEQQYGNFFYDRLLDGSLAPEMAWIPSGQFWMGNKQGNADEKPVHKVSLNRFAISRYEVTFVEYDRFAIATGNLKPDDNGWGRGNRPVINVSWKDAVAYTNWLSEQTGHQYRFTD
jgi:hypothetical protein